MTELLNLTETDVPQDVAPDFDEPVTPVDSPPDATEEAPYGYTASGRIRKKPVGSRSNAGPRASSGRNEKLAADAASLLARMNNMVGLSLSMFGMTRTGDELAKANADFEAMAREALVNDPALARKILSGGATSGKTQLLMAYTMLGMSVGPAAYTELKENRRG